MAADQILICGVPFMSLFHHDGRFIRAPGLFAFGRRLASGRHLVLHLELADAIHQRAGHFHPRWSWALSQRMDELLVHLAGGRAEIAPGAQEAAWHREAEVVFDAAADLSLLRETVGARAPAAVQADCRGTARSASINS